MLLITTRQNTYLQIKTYMSSSLATVILFKNTENCIAIP